MSWFENIGSVLLTGSQSAARNRQQQQQQGQPPGQQQSPSPSSSGRLLENVLGVTGAFLKSKGEADRADRAQAMNNEQVRATLNQRSAQFKAEFAARLAEAKRQQNLSRAVAAAEASPLGENENFATRNRILSAIIPNLRNFNITPGNSAIAAAMPKIPGFLPEGGLPPSVVAALSDRAIAAAISNRNKQVLNIDPKSPVADLNALGLAPAQDDLGPYRQALLDEGAADEASLENTIQRALMQDYEGIARIPGDPPPAQEKKGGFWNTLGKIASFAAPIVAAPFTGGASLALIGAGSGAASAALNGGGAKDIALGGAIGATAGLGGKKKLEPKAPATTNRMRVVPPVGGY